MVTLIVDDDPVSLLLAEHILTVGGYDIVTAVSANDAIQTLADIGGDVACIVCDYMMPGANGLDLLESLTADEARPCPPFVLLTGVSEADELNDERVASASAYLTKPVQSDELLAVVAKVLALVETEAEVSS